MLLTRSRPCGVAGLHCNPSCLGESPCRVALSVALSPRFLPPSTALRIYKPRHPSSLLGWPVQLSMPWSHEARVRGAYFLRNTWYLYKTRMYLPVLHTAAVNGKKTSKYPEVRQQHKNCGQKKVRRKMLRTENMNDGCLPQHSTHPFPWQLCQHW